MKSIKTYKPDTEEIQEIYRQIKFVVKSTLTLDFLRGRQDPQLKEEVARTVQNLKNKATEFWEQIVRDLGETKLVQKMISTVHKFNKKTAIFDVLDSFLTWCKVMNNTVAIKDLKKEIPIYAGKF